MIVQVAEEPERSVATAHDLYRTMEFMDVFREPELLDINLPIASLGTVDFSRPREGRYQEEECEGV